MKDIIGLIEKLNFRGQIRLTLVIRCFNVKLTEADNYVVIIPRNIYTKYLVSKG